MKTKKTSKKKSSKKNQVTSAHEANGQNLIKDPVLFATRILGADLWEREVEILRSIKHRRLEAALL